MIHTPNFFLSTLECDIRPTDLIAHYTPSVNKKKATVRSMASRLVLEAYDRQLQVPYNVLRSNYI